MQRISFALLLAALITSQQVTAATPVAAENTSQPLTLERALALVQAHNPELAAAKLEIVAAEGGAQQAAMRPNPSLTIEAENFAGSGDLRGGSSAEYTAQIEQPIELGGKRAKRTQVAELGKSLAGFDLATKRLDLQTETRKRFVAVQVAQERVALSEEFAKLAEEFLRASEARVRAGKVSPLEETKAGIELANQKIERDQAQRELVSVRAQLAAMWGATTPEFKQVEGSVEKIPSLPSQESLAGMLSRNPDVARWSVELKQRQAALAATRADRVPDVSVAGGVRQFAETSDHAFVVGVSMPFPVLNRNQGAIRESAAQLAKAEQEQRAAELKARTDMIASHQSLAAAIAKASALDKEVVPAAQNVLAATKAGYAQGKFTYLEVLEAQRAFFEARAARLDALADCQTALVDVQRLTGGTAGDLQGTTK